MLLWIPVSQNNTILYTLVAQLYSFVDAYHTRGHINTITKYITAKPVLTGKTMFVQLPVNLPLISDKMLITLTYIHILNIYNAKKQNLNK